MKAHLTDPIVTFQRALDQPADGVRMQEIVGVEKKQKTAPGRGNADIPRCAEATVRLLQVTDPTAKSGGDRERVVIRAVVDNDHFDLPVCLFERTLDRSSEEDPLLKAGNHDRYEVSAHETHRPRPRTGGSSVASRIRSVRLHLQNARNSIQWHLVSGR
jgi:hypothetical protein